MFNFIFLFLLVAIFVVILFMVSTLNRTRRIVLLVLYGILSAAYLALNLGYIHSHDYDPSFMYVGPLLGVTYAAQLFGRLRLARHAGPLVLRMRQANPMAIIGFVAAPVFLLIASFFLVPNTRDAATGMPIYDDYYIKSRLSMLCLCVPAVVYYFVMARQRTEFHERGIMQGSILWTWASFESYAWEETSNASEIQLAFKSKANKRGSQPVKYSIPSQNKPALDELLKRSY